VKQERGALLGFQREMTSACLLPLVRVGDVKVRGVSLARPQCAMLMVTDALQLDELTGFKVLCH